jgi:hypothetical protein
VTVNTVVAVAVVGVAVVEKSVTGPTVTVGPGALGRGITSLGGGDVTTFAKANPMILEVVLNETVVLPSITVSPLFAITLIGAAQTFTAGQNNKQILRSA